MMHYYSDLGSARTDWLKFVFNLSVASTTLRIWVVTLHHYVIFLLFRQTSFHRETSSGVKKNECWLFSQASNNVNNDLAVDN